MNRYKTALWNRYENEVEKRFSEFQAQYDTIRASAPQTFPSIRQHSSGQAAGATGLLDCLFLYLLVRYYKPRVIFEIGTWIGTSALFMAEALKKNGDGHIYTCDVHNYYHLSDKYTDIITFLPQHSDEALMELKEQGLKLDLVFADGILSRASTRLLSQMSHKHTMITSHDVALPAEKGVRNLIYLFPYFHTTHTMTLPRSCQINTGPGHISVNKAIGELAPGTTLAGRFKGFLLYIVLGLFYYPGRILKKLGFLNS